MKRFPLFLAVVALVIWVYFNNRQGGVEMYNAEREELIGYIMGDEINPDSVSSDSWVVGVSLRLRLRLLLLTFVMDEASVIPHINILQGHSRNLGYHYPPQSICE